WRGISADWKLTYAPLIHLLGPMAGPRTGLDEHTSQVLIRGSHLDPDRHGFAASRPDDRLLKQPSHMPREYVERGGFREHHVGERRRTLELLIADIRADTEYQ